MPCFVVSCTVSSCIHFWLLSWYSQCCDIIHVIGYKNFGAIADSKNIIRPIITKETCIRRGFISHTYICVNRRVVYKRHFKGLQFFMIFNIHCKLFICSDNSDVKNYVRFKRLYQYVTKGNHIIWAIQTCGWCGVIR